MIPIGTGEILLERGHQVGSVALSTPEEARVTDARAAPGVVSPIGRVALIGYGSGVGKALEAAEELRGSRSR